MNTENTDTDVSLNASAAVSPSELEGGISQVLEGLLGAQQKENVNTLERLSQVMDFERACKAVVDLDADGYYFALPYELSNAQRGLFEKLFPGKHQVHFIFEHSRFLETQFEAFLKKYESDSGCIADKSGFLVQSALAYYALQRPIVLNRTQRYTYHLPKVVFTQEAEILGFFEVVYDMFYGRVQPYLDFCQRMQERLTA